MGAGAAERRVAPTPRLLTPRPATARRRRRAAESEGRARAARAASAASAETVEAADKRDAAPTAPPGAGGERFVTLHLKLRDWPFLDSSLRLRATAPLFKVRDHLVERHGHLAELRIFKGALAAEHEMADETRTLESYGIEGRADDGGEPAEVDVHYDFVPEMTDPLLSC